MPTKRPKHKRTGENVTAAEVAARREELTLRRARNQQLRIRALARSLSQAIVRADAARLSLARVLCEGTGWGVFGNAEVDEWQTSAGRHERKYAELASRNEQLGKQIEQAESKIKYLDGELRRLEGGVTEAATV